MTSFLLVLAISLLLCLVLFLAQVHWHAKDALEPDFLWAYHINWWSDFLYTFSGESFPCLMQEGWKRKSLLEREVESGRNRSTDCSYLGHSYMEKQHDMVRKSWILESGNLGLATCSTIN